MHCAAALALLSFALLLAPGLSAQATTATAPGCHGVACRAKAVSKDKHTGAAKHGAASRDTQGESTGAKQAGAAKHGAASRDTQAQEKRPTQSDEDVLNAFLLLQHGIATPTPTPTPTVTMPAQPTTFDGAICSAFPAACRNAGIC